MGPPFPLGDKARSLEIGPLEVEFCTGRGQPCRQLEQQHLRQGGPACAKALSAECEGWKGRKEALVAAARWVRSDREGTGSAVKAQKLDGGGTGELWPGPGPF